MPTVTVHLTRWDLVRLTVFATPRNSGVQWILFALVALVTSNLVATRGWPTTGKGWVVILLTTLVFAAGAGLATILISAAAVCLTTGKGHGVLGRHDYQAREDGLLEVTSANETLTKWGGATALYRRGHFLCIKVPPGMFHVIPRRFFQSDQEFETFWSAIQRLVPDKSLERTRAG